MVCLSLCGLQRKGIFLVNRCIVDVHTTGFLYLSLIPPTGVSPTLPLLLCIRVSAAAFSVASSHYTCMSSDNDLSLSPVQGVVWWLSLSVSTYLTVSVSLCVHLCVPAYVCCV